MKYPCKIQAAHVEELDNELCVYDTERKVVHNLNPTAALVWEQCDGSTSPAQIATKLHAELGTPHAEDVVWVSLDELKKAHLINGDVTQPAGRSLLNRRTMIKGMAVAAVPVVVSIVAPSAVQAQSPGQPPVGPVGTWREGGDAAGADEPFFDNLSLTNEQILVSAQAVCPGDGAFDVGTVENAAECAAAAEAANADFYRWGATSAGGNCTWIFC